ncbi:MAG TPA: YciI family protein, partial [Polyangiaceae bacterium]
NPRRKPMRFMVLVPASADSEAGVMPTHDQLAEMQKFNEELVKAGVMLAGDGLHPTSRGARVRFEGGSKTVVDGPFTESKELVAGYWILQVRSREEAIEWIKRAPFDKVHSHPVTVELRQIFDPADFAASDPTGELRERGDELRTQASKPR